MTTLKQHQMATDPSQINDALSDDELTLVVGGFLQVDLKVMRGKQSRIFDWYGEDFYQVRDNDFSV